MFIRVASLALGQSGDCPSASEVTLKHMGKKGPKDPIDNKSTLLQVMKSPRLYELHTTDR